MDGNEACFFAKSIVGESVACEVSLSFVEEFCKAVGSKRFETVQKRDGG